MTCFAYEDNLSAYIDDELSPELRREIEAHLASCERCRKDCESHLLAWETAGHLRAEPAPEGLWAAVEPEIQDRAGAVTTEDLALIVRGLAGEVRDLRRAVETLREHLETDAPDEDRGRGRLQQLRVWSEPSLRSTKQQSGS